MEKILETHRGSVIRLPPAPSYTRPVTFHYEIQHYATRMQRLTKVFNVYRLTVLTLVCVIAGLTIGLLCRPYAKDWTERQFMYIEIPGELYLRFLKLMIIPLIVSNVILSFGSIQGKLSSHLAKVASFLYLGSNFMAIAVAIILALLMSPGGRPNVDNFSKGRANGMQLNLNNHHLFTDYHDSIRRYREYHPMFYHTDRERASIFHHMVQAVKKTPNNNSLVATQNTEKSSSHINVIKKQSSQGEELVNLLRHTHEISSEPLNLEKFEQPGEEIITNEHPHLVKTSDEHDGTSSLGISELLRIGMNTKLPIDVLLDVLRNLVPDSLIRATLQQTRTRLFAPKELVIDSNGTAKLPPSHWPMGHEMVDQANIIGLLAVSVLIGVTLSHMEEASKPLLDLCACVSELSLRVGMLAVNIAPICIMFLLIGQVARARDLGSMAGELFKYSLTVIVALIIHGSILLPLIYYLMTKKSPLKFLVGLLEALIASFATSSSSATMALTLNCLDELDLNPVIVRAFGPLGSVFNMNGTAIYEAVGTIFIAQTLGVTLPLTSLLLIGFSSAVASLSTAGIPSSGMMTMVIVLNAVNLPVLQLSLIYIVDFIIDRFRTVVNVWSAAIVCGLIDHICPQHLFEEEMDPEKYKELVKYRRSRITLSSRKSSSVEEESKPQVISVTITPPLESSCM